MPRSPRWWKPRSRIASPSRSPQPPSSILAFANASDGASATSIGRAEPRTQPNLPHSSQENPISTLAPNTTDYAYNRSPFEGKAAAVATEDDLAQMDSMLRGELAAVATYDKAIDALDFKSYKPVLRKCRDSHQDRANLLTRELTRLGQAPSTSGGLWETFTTLIEGGAAAISDDLALTTLREGEMIGLRQHESDMLGMSKPLYRLVRKELLPRQRETLSTLNSLIAEVNH